MKEILSSKGISYGTSHRLSEVYKRWASKSKDITSKGETSVSAIEFLTMLDLCEMNAIIKILESIPADILKEKWKLLKHGVVNRFEETAQNSKARDAQFELLLYAELMELGVNCTMSHPNPDILVEHNGIGLNIQCKRIFNNKPNAIQRNVHAAASQLRSDHTANGYMGVIALSIERIFSGGDLFLQSPTQQDAVEYLRRMHNAFYDQNKRFWNSKLQLGTANIPTLIFHTSAIARVTEEATMFAHVSERDLMGTIPSENSRKKFRKINHLFRSPRRD